MKNTLQRFAPVLALGLLTLAFFWKILLTNLILVGVDVFLYFYPYRAYVADALLGGRFPLWNPHIFMGVPFLANSQAGLLYPPNWLFLWASPPKQVAYSIGLHIWLAGVGAYCFARRSLNLTRPGALVGAMVFALGGFLGAQAEHINQLQVSAWLPWIFWLFDRLRTGPPGDAVAAGPLLREAALPFRQTVALLGVIIALMLLAGHSQSVYISLFGLGIYGLFQMQYPLRSPRKLAARLLAALAGFVPLLAAIALALLVSAAQLWPTLQLAQHSLRSGGLSYNEAVAFSLNPLALGYTLLPPYGVNLEMKLGQAFSEFVAYIGLLPLLLAGWAALRLLRAGAGRVRGLAVTGAAGLLLALGVFTGPLYILLYRFVPGFNLFRVPARWLLLYALAAAMLAGAGFDRLKGALRPLAAGLIALELFIAAQELRYNQPTAPEAYSSLRPAIAQLLAAQSPTDRFLSLSGIVYDPGDLQDIHTIFDSQLPPRAVYDYIIAAKQKEVLFFNLPMVYHLNAVDGYDGGLLPLERFMDLERLFLADDALSPDGRLREKLDRVPPGRLLSLLGVRHIVTDKVFDVWLDNIFYDLQFPATLSPGATSHIWTEDIPDFPAPAIGVVYHTPPQSRGKAAQLVVRYASGLEKRFDIRAGDGRPWDNKEFGRDYNLVFTGLPAASDGPITAVGVIASRPIVVRGVSLIQPAGPTSRSLILTTEGNYRAIHGGDVKIYENLDVMPRAFVVHQTQVVSGVRQAVAELKSPRFDPAAAIVRPVRSGESPGLLTLGRPGSPASVTIVAYLPERVELLAELTSPGWLVFTDTDYPGWRATIDGADTEILEADIMFRAVELPAGPHRIIFEYRPIPFYGGIIVSLLGLGLIAGGLAAGGGKKPSNKTGKQVDATLDNTYNQG